MAILSCFQDFFYSLNVVVKQAAKKRSGFADPSSTTLLADVSTDLPATQL
jgi:hypothetical protein